MTKILIYGGNGWIGGMMCVLLSKKNIVFVKSNVRVNDKKAVEEELYIENPTHVMSFIGRTHGNHNGTNYTTIDFLEQKGRIRENVRDNLFSPLVLAILCSRRNIHFTYLGTGCIFTYDDEHPFGKVENGFTESSLPNFFGSSYSVVKGYTDRMINQINENALNLRIRMPITSEKSGRNFITKITTYKKICSVSNSMTVLPELLPFVLDMMKNNQKGTINLTNPGLISHNEILEMFKEIVDPEFTYQNFSQEEQRKILAADRSNNYLDTTKLEFFYTEKNCTPKYDYGEGWGMGHYVYKKNITKLSKKGYDMNKVLMVDDKPEHIDSYGNVIKIPPFYGDTNDTYLLKLKEYLKEIKDEPNYRKIEKRGWSN